MPAGSTRGQCCSVSAGHCWTRDHIDISRACESTGLRVRYATCAALPASTMAAKINPLVVPHHTWSLPLLGWYPHPGPCCAATASSSACHAWPPPCRAALLPSTCSSCCLLCPQELLKPCFSSKLQLLPGQGIFCSSTALHLQNQAASMGGWALNWAWDKQQRGRVLQRRGLPSLSTHLVLCCWLCCLPLACNELLEANLPFMVCPIFVTVLVLATAASTCCGCSHRRPVR